MDREQAMQSAIEPDTIRSYELLNKEWAAVMSLLHLALEAGCPASNASSAYDTLLAQMRELPPPAKAEEMTAPEVCPKCRHRSHSDVCFNMASDNECNCTYTVTAPEVCE